MRGKVLHYRTAAMHVMGMTPQGSMISHNLQIRFNHKYTHERASLALLNSQVLVPRSVTSLFSCK